MYICITESLCCVAEINTTLCINYTSIKKKKLDFPGSSVGKNPSGNLGDSPAQGRFHVPWSN